MNQQQSQDPLYAGPRQAGRGQYNARNPPPNTGAIPRANGRQEEAGDSTQSRAARYEDEKRRIVESCFAKREEDGVAAESYITHVRVSEDAAYPSNPPPPESPAANKKSRVILVAVRKTGRVRVHKARENPTGTFSIGKTWPLEELTNIRSYTNLQPRNNQEQMEKQWAGGMGFTVTLGKSYYWQAPTPKEKDFFIGSLVKIYRKYTGGKLPDLSGFAPHEIELLTGTPMSPNLQSQIQTPPLATQSLSPPPPIPASSERRPQTPQSVRSQGSDQPGRLRAQSRNDQGPPARDAQRPPPIEPLRAPVRSDDRQSSRDGRGQASLDGMSTKSQGTDQFSASTGYLPTSNLRPSPSPQSSQLSLAEEKTNGRALNGIPRPPQPPYADIHQGAPSSIHSGSSRPGTAVSERRPSESRPEIPPGPAEPSPDRRRPFQAKAETNLAPKSGAASETTSQFATPAVSPSDMPDTVPELNLAKQDQLLNSSKTVPERNYQEPDKHTSANDISQISVVSGTTSIHAQSTVAPAEFTATETEPTSLQQKSEEEHRPGLGPMVKKKSTKDIAGQFRKAAMAASAFQPRQGGAGARLKALQDKDKASGEPDGITSVVPAPLLRGMSSDTAKSSAPATPVTALSQEQLPSTNASDIVPKVHIERSATEDSVLTPDVALADPLVLPHTPTPEEPEVQARSSSPEQTRSRSPQRRRRQRQEADISRYCSALNIDVSVLGLRGGDFNDLLTEFGWDGKLAENRQIDDFEAQIKREIGRAQATGWLGHVEQQEGKVHDLAKAFDKAIQECEELDGLFTLYAHELDTLAADIEYIEAQSQGLQVQTANQKLLQKELSSLLATLTISDGDTRPIHTATLDTESGIETVERSLSLLYNALIMIDPNMRQNKARQTVSSNPDRGGIGVYANTDIGQMRAVREKKELYNDTTRSFVLRFSKHMTALFKTLDQNSVDHNRQSLWKYNAVLLFVREVNENGWKMLTQEYMMGLKDTYSNHFKDYAMSQRKNVRKAGSEDVDGLFTTQEKDKSDETLASTAARKLTVKRGKTVKAGALRQQLSDKNDGKLNAYEVFGTVLKHQCSTVFEEQNYFTRLFNISSQNNADFIEIVTSKPSYQRKLPNLHTKQPYEPERDMAKTIHDVTEGLFASWFDVLRNLLDWALGMDSLQGVGVLVTIEQCLGFYADTNQDCILQTLQKIHKILDDLFWKFVDEQIRAIEETKVKVKKRKGVISFMRTFPLFSAMIEQMIPSDMPVNNTLEIRFTVDKAYGRILKAMWESLNFIAKDDLAAGGTAATPASGDPEDKEALNYHILLIENMNHYMEEVETQRNNTLEEWADRAKRDYLTHLTQYIDSVIRRPLGKWLDFLENTEAMMKSSEASGISNKASNAKGAVKKILAGHDSKEIKKGVETLKKRIEKHFGDAEDPSSTSKTLISKVLQACSARYASAHDRMKSIIDTSYDGSLEIDWRKEEVDAIFKR